VYFSHNYCIIRVSLFRKQKSGPCSASLTKFNPG
jgi:hypothetical protein